MIGDGFNRVAVVVFGPFGAAVCRKAWTDLEDLRPLQAPLERLGVGAVAATSWRASL